MEKKIKITLIMDLKRAQFLYKALDVVARIGMGQFQDMARLIRPMMNYSDIKQIEDYLKKALHMDLSSNSYHGILCNEVPEECKVACDAYQHLRREVSWLNDGKDWRTDQRDWNTMMTGNYDTPMKVSGLQGDFQTAIQKE